MESSPDLGLYIMLTHLLVHASVFFGTMLTPRRFSMAIREALHLAALSHTCNNCAQRNSNHYFLRHISRRKFKCDNTGKLFSNTQRKNTAKAEGFFNEPAASSLSKKGFHESKIAVRFWIITLMLVIASILTLKVR